MTKSLVIVESPAKARTISGFLGDSFVVESSIGHIRDLPKKAKDVPPEYKKLKWARLGVDVDNDFKPLYVVDAEKKQHISRLKQLLKGADELYLATDEDREGESIAWHLYEVLQPKVPVRRMVFHEITRKAIDQALKSPRQIDRRLVNAQEARRILDRLFGFEVSPVLWKKVMRGLSAGRVQSVATRVLVERERERMRFVAATYWDLEGLLGKADGGELKANLVQVDGKRLATGKDFGSTGRIGKPDEVLVLGEQEAKALAADLTGQPFTVRSVERKPYKRQPSPPFMTSTLQQEAGRKLRFGAARTMKAAQRLYENGYITYMRTDSTTLSEAAITSARKLIGQLYGAEYVPSAPRTYANKVKNAQEAHEAIRPAGESWKTPDQVARELSPDESKVYELVWKRTVASQMQDVRGESVVVRIQGQSRGNKARKVELSVAGNTILFPGFYRAYVEGSDDPDAELESRDRPLPSLTEGEALAGKTFTPHGHETQPPARFTEASLVRKLEELGVGRPSTYASTLSTIQDRGYVKMKGTAMVPSWTAFAVVGLLEKHFPELIDYAFTARMEDDLDSIANGAQESIPWLRRFYFGDVAREIPDDDATENGLRAMVNDHLDEIDARAVNSIAIGTDPNDVEIVARVGRYGPYIQRGEDTVSIPESLAPDEVTVEKALELLSAPRGARSLGDDPTTGLPVLIKVGSKGTYIQLGERGDSEDRPKTASLFATMSPATITLEEALKLLSLPRTVGIDPADDQPVTAQNGPFGPYVQKGTESRSLESEEQIFTIDLPAALEVLAKPKERRRRNAAATGPLRELGEDPVSNKTIQLKDGRFGPYVTDGDTIASLRKSDTIDGITPERAQELLAERRERGPSEKKTKKKSSRSSAKASAPKAGTESKPSKKSPAKKAPSKKASSKKASSKVAPADDQSLDAES